MSKYPTPDDDRPDYRYPSKYYRGYYLIRDPSEWNTKGKIVPIQRLPPRARATHPEEEEYRIRKHKRPRIIFLFHPEITDPYYAFRGYRRTMRRWI